MVGSLAKCARFLATIDTSSRAQCADLMHYPRDLAAELSKSLQTLDDLLWSDVGMGEGQRSDTAKVPRHLEPILESVFFASLLPEEGAIHPISVIVLLDGHGQLPPRTNRCSWPAMPLTPGTLRKMGALSAPRDALLMITGGDDGPLLCGIAMPPPGAFYGFGRPLTITATAPGSLVIARGGAELMRYVGGRIQRPPVSPFGLHDVRIAAVELLQQPVVDDFRSRGVEELLKRLAHAVSSTRHGGMLVCCEDPARYIGDAVVLEHPLDIGTTAHELIHDQFSYQEEELQRDEVNELETRIDANAAALDKMIDQAGRFSAIDGAIVFDPRLDLVAFGCKLRPGDPPAHIRHIRSWPSDGGAYDLTQHGTRHRAAAAFAAAAESNLAICVSQDGPVNAFFQLDGSTCCWPLPQGSP